MSYIEFSFAIFMAGIVWIGMLYYFNIVETETEAGGAKSDAMAKLAPRTVVVPLGRHAHFPDRGVLVPKGRRVWHDHARDLGGRIGGHYVPQCLAGGWPNQQIVLGMKEGDGPAAAAKAGLASRTNCCSAPCCWACWVPSILRPFPKSAAQ